MLRKLNGSCRKRASTGVVKAAAPAAVPAEFLLGACLTLAAVAARGLLAPAPAVRREILPAPPRPPDRMRRADARPRSAPGRRHPMRSCCCRSAIRIPWERDRTGGARPAHGRPADLPSNARLSCDSGVRSAVPKAGIGAHGGHSAARRRARAIVARDSAACLCGRPQPC